METENAADAIDTQTNGDSDTQEDFDSFWKELVGRFFYTLLKRAIPELYEKADTSKEERILGNEFTDVLNTGKREIHQVGILPTW